MVDIVGKVVLNDKCHVELLLFSICVCVCVSAVVPAMMGLIIVVVFFSSVWDRSEVG